MTQPLSRQLLPRPKTWPDRIAQFGGGNFLRGFVDWVVEILNEETDFGSGIVLVKATPGTYDALDRQDRLFTTWLHGIQDGQAIEQSKLITSVNRTVYPYQDFESYLDVAKQASIRFIFSNTTEAGIAFDPNDSQLDRPPASFPAKLTRFLLERYQHFGGAADKGCIIIPTELIVDNADRLREIILRYADLWALEPDFAAWIHQHNLFCNTLVDRIISGYPQADAQRIFARLGYEDPLLVAGEIYHSWIIEAEPTLLDEFPIDKTRTPLNVKIVSDAAPHRTIKVRLLNGAHTAMAPLGCLLGIESVRQAIEHETLGPFVQNLIFQEVIPSIADIPQAELTAFARDVFDRFRNPHIHHRLLTIALNTSAKLKERLTPSLLAYLDAKGELPPRLVIALAGFVRFYKGEWRGETIPLNDDEQVLLWFKAQWAQVDDGAVSIEDLARAVLANAQLWGTDLSQRAGLVDQLGAALQAIENGQLLELLKRDGA